MLKLLLRSKTSFFTQKLLSIYIKYFEFTQTLFDRDVSSTYDLDYRGLLFYSVVEKKYYKLFKAKIKDCFSFKHMLKLSLWSIVVALLLFFILSESLLRAVLFFLLPTLLLGALWGCALGMRVLLLDKNMKLGRIIDACLNLEDTLMKNSLCASVVAAVFLFIGMQVSISNPFLIVCYCGLMLFGILPLGVIGGFISIKRAVLFSVISYEDLLTFSTNHRKGLFGPSTELVSDLSENQKEFINRYVSSLNRGVQINNISISFNNPKDIYIHSIRQAGIELFLELEWKNFFDPNECKNAVRKLRKFQKRFEDLSDDLIREGFHKKLSEYPEKERSQKIHWIYSKSDNQKLKELLYPLIAKHFAHILPIKGIFSVLNSVHDNPFSLVSFSLTGLPDPAIQKIYAYYLESSNPKKRAKHLNTDNRLVA